MTTYSPIPGAADRIVRTAALLPPAAFLAAAAFCLTPWSSPAVALALGAALAILLGNPFRRPSQHAAKWLLQSSVVLLGFGMDLPTVLRAGSGGFAFAAVSIAATLLLGRFLGNWLKVAPHASALISAGTAICGGSAIAAVGSALDADEGDMTVAMGTVFLLNAAALYLFPVLGHALHLTPHQFGTWAGVAIHDVSSVVGAASRYGPGALETATAVKLSRALWIVPVVVGMAWASDRHRTATVGNASFGFATPAPIRRRQVQVPWFIGLFLLASVARSFVPGVAGAAPALSHVAVTALTLTLFLIGGGLDRDTLAAVGWKALLQGTLLWVFISAASLAVILLTVA
jgi:uncharacterized integral membrane protein (TIGR00698 family)